MLGTNAQVLLSARSPSLTLRCAKQRRNVPASVLALSVIASRCHLSQSERPWQSAKFPVQYFTPCCRKGAEGAALRLHAFAKGSPFGGAGAKRLRGQARLRRDFASVSIEPMIRANAAPLAEGGGAASGWKSYHLNPHFLKYRIRFPVCQRAGFRLRWAARCHAWMAVYWGTR